MTGSGLCCLNEGMRIREEEECEKLVGRRWTSRVEGGVGWGMIKDICLKESGQGKGRRAF